MSKAQKITEDIKNDVEKIAKEGGISLLGNILGKGLFFVTQIVIVRLFGTEVFGLYVLGITVAKMIEIVSRFGLDFGSMRFVSIYHKDDAARTKGIILSSMGISFIGSIVIGVLLYLSAGFISESFFCKPELKEVIRALSICIPFVSTTFVLTSATQGFHTTKYAVYIREIFQPAINISFILIFFFTSLGLRGAIFAFAISYLSTFILSLYFLNKVYLDSIKEKTKAIFEVKNILMFSIPLMFVSILNYIPAWTDILMLGHFVSSKDISIYRVASLVPFLLTLVLNASNSIYAPLVAKLYDNGESNRLDGILKITTRWVFNITLPALIIMVFFSRFIMSLFGTEFVEQGAPILIILALAHFVNCVTGGVAYTLIMTGKQKVEFLNAVVTVITNIVLNYLLIPKYGGLGAAVATGIAYSAINLIRLFEVYYLYRIHPYNMNYIPEFIAAGMSIIILYLLGQINLLSGYFLFVLGIIATISTFLLSFCLSVKTEEDKHILYVVKTKFSDLIIKMGILKT